VTIKKRNTRTTTENRNKGKTALKEFLLAELLLKPGEFQKGTEKTWIIKNPSPRVVLINDLILEWFPKALIALIAVLLLVL